MQLQYRMYGLVPYNLSPIQQGIQFGHAVVEYMIKYSEPLSPCMSWAENDKTFIILNGGTTNDNYTLKDAGPLFNGSLNNHKQWLLDNNIPHASFSEPDLGNQLTAVVFLVDEKVWNIPDYNTWLETKGYAAGLFYVNLSDNSSAFGDYWYNLYKEEMGENNLKLKTWLSQFKLA